MVSPRPRRGVEVNGWGCDLWESTLKTPVRIWWRASRSVEGRPAPAWYFAQGLAPGTALSRVLIQHDLSDLVTPRQVSGSHRESVVREAFKDLLKGWVHAQANVCALMRFGDWCKN